MNDEAPLDLAQPIVDAHHHLYDRPGSRYLQDELRADLRGGHKVYATVFVQARSHYRPEGPEALKPVGETTFASRVAQEFMAAGDPVHACAAIVGFADLTQGADAVRPVLQAHIDAGGGRFRGIRHITAWDADSALLNPAYPSSEAMMDSTPFRAGFAQLAPLGLSFDAWLFFHQIPRLTALARAFPQTPIVLNHCGGVLGTGRYAGRGREVFAAWSTALRELAACSNVSVKLGGLGMKLTGLGFDGRHPAASSAELADAWRPWMNHCIEVFGTKRCMFESNFPADAGTCSYTVAWNAMKRVAAHASADEKADLFWRSAARFYKLQGPAGPESEKQHG